MFAPNRFVHFTPSVDLKDELAATAVQITCYDRNGDEVRRVTSTDDGTVEDNDNENQNQNGGGSSNTNSTNLTDRHKKS
jgi:hypothetical protein